MRILINTAILSFLAWILVPCIASAQVTSKGLTGDEQMKLESLLKAMTPEEKAGQLSLFTSDYLLTGPAGSFNLKSLIREGNVGAVLNAVGVDSVKALQKIAVEQTRLKIPLLFGLDVIHGYRTIFPIPLAQACMWDLASIERIERIAATEATASGINWTYAPMVDLARDPRWGRVAEGAGEDTWLGSRIAAARVRGFQGNDLKAENTLMACVKHYAAYGAAQAGRDYNTVDMSEVSLREWYLPPYKAAIDAGCGSVMTSFNEISGVPSTSSHLLMTDILRNEWGFGGFVVTDWTAISELINHGVAGTLKDAAKLAMNAGVDMDMMGGSYMEYIPDLVNEKQVLKDRVDAAVTKVLEAKFKLGLFDDPYRYCNKEREKHEILTKENIDFARKTAAESCVLLKNQNNTLPVSDNVKSIAVIGSLGDSKHDMLGCWWGEGNPDDCVTLLDGVRNRVGKDVVVTFTKGCNVNENDTSGFSAAIEAAKNADFVLLALGEGSEAAGEASSRADIGLPGVQEELAEAVARTGKPLAVVLFNGRPLVLTRLSGVVPAILETWFGGTQAGNGIADVLFGDVNPAGKLTMTFPRSMGQIPIFYNTKNTGRPYDPSNPDEKYVSRYLDESNDPLYPFGYGLSYTTFTFSDIKTELNGNSIGVSVTITNTGTRDGAEVAQLYVHEKVASMTRPVKELRGFQKVFLKKGESKVLTFSLSTDDLAFWHADLKKYYEPGDFTVYIGNSSADCISATFNVK